MLALPRNIFVVMLLGGVANIGPAAFAQDDEHEPGGFDCAYQSPQQVRQAIDDAVAAGEILDPALRVLPRVAPRSIQPGATVRGAGVPTVTQADIFQFQDTAGLLLTNFSSGQLFNLLGAASNAVLAAHGDNFDFIAFFVNFTPHHQLGAAFYLGLENDVTGIGTGIFNSRALMGVAGDNVEGWVIMWKESSWSPGTTNFTALVLGQEFEHRFAMFLNPLQDGRQFQGTIGCGRVSHWNFRVDAQGSGMEVSEWVGAAPAILACSNNCVNTDIGGVFSYPDLYLMGYVSGAEMDSGASELRYMNDSCISPYSGPISTWTSADVVAANGPRIPDSTAAQKDFRTAWVMLHQPGSPPTTPQLDNVVAILNSWNDAWISSTLGRGTMNNTLVRDCNANGIPDADDIIGGTSADCNGNGNPDECDEDCNSNGAPDDCDVAAGTSPDCNANGIPDECEPDCNGNGTADECDITAGASDDCNANGIPDECEPQDDCNFNLVQDICDIAGGTSDDFNANGIPDDCEPDCNGNGVPDSTEFPLPLFLNDSPSLAPYTEPYTSRAFPYEYVPIAQDIHLAAEALLRGFDISFASGGADFTTPVSLIVRFYDNNADNTEFPTQSGLIAQYTSAGDFACVSAASPPCGTNQTFSFFIASPVLVLQDLWMEVEFVQSSVFNDPPFAAHDPWGVIQKAGPPNTGTSAGVVFDAADGAPVAGTVFLDVAVRGIQCTSDCQPNQISDRCDISCFAPGCNVGGCGQSSDCNANGVPDECEDDCNNSGAPDTCDIASGTSQDCNNNTIPDECDIAAGTSPDCNANGIPDECELDCNANGIPDECDIAFGTSLDCQAPGQRGFGIPDECEIPQSNPGGLCLFDCDFDCNNNGIPDSCDAAAANDCQPNEIPDGCPLIDFLRIYDPDQTIGQVAPLLPINNFWQKDPSDAQELPDLRLERIGTGGSLVFSLGSSLASTGSRVFASATTGATSWSSAVQLQAEFGGILPTRVAIDVIPASIGSTGRLEIFDADSLSRGSILSPGGLDAGTSTRIFLDYPGGIARAVMGASPNQGTVILDNLVAYSPALDCNANTIPDECEADGDGDLLPDTCEEDCNGNGIGDDIDIAGVTSEDCNLNDIPDECDLADGLSADCNANGVPDECDPDCNLSGFPDACDITSGTSQDCNDNTIPDECEIAAGTSPDCNANGILDVCDAGPDCNLNDIPDECESDCNGNTTPDDCDVLAGAPDINGNLVPDECDLDCNLNGVPDALDIAGPTSTDCNANAVPDECLPVDFLQDCEPDDLTFLGDQPIEGACLAATLAQANSAGDVIADVFVLEGPLASDGSTILASTPTHVFARSFIGQQTWPPTNLLRADFHATHFGASGSMGRVTIDVLPPAGGGQAFLAAFDESGSEIARASSGFMLDASPFRTLVVQSPGPQDDIAFVLAGGENGFSAVLDNLRYFDENTDCDSNNTPDDCDFAAGTGTDCNANSVLDDCEPDCNATGIPDECDITAGTSLDCNANGIPDECDPDCNANGVPDECELHEDCNGNDVQDICDIAGGSSEDCNANGIPDECDIAAGGEGPPTDSCTAAPPICPGVAFGGSTSSASGDGSATCGLSNFCPDVWYAYTPSQSGTATVSLCGSSYDSVLSVHTSCPGTTANQIVCNDDFCGVQSEVAWSAVGGTTYLVRVSGFFCSTGSFTLQLTGPACEPVNDCNTNGIPDDCDIAEGTSEDCNGNGVLDECEIASGAAADCNSNGVPDECDIAAGTSEDCNSNGVPDECDPAEDCNSNSVQDICDIALGTSQDCQNDEIPDECQLADNDCNDNGNPDDCDLGDTFLAASPQLSPIHANAPQSFTIASPPPANQGVILDFVAQTDLGFSSEFIIVEINGTPVGVVFDFSAPDCVELADQLFVPAALFNSAVAGGDATISMIASSNVNDFCAGSFITVTIAYAGFTEDCNTNAIPDECDVALGTSEDCNANGIPDECDTGGSVLLSEAFAGELPAGWSATGLWHVTDQCVQSGSCDPLHWGFYGLDSICNFNTGQVTAGNLVAPVFVIPSFAASATLSYCSVYRGESGDSPFGFDSAWVSANGVEIDDVSAAGATGGWGQRTADLGAFVGDAVTLSFNFDSGDGVFNDELGWQVGQIVITTSATSSDCNLNGVPDECEPDCNVNTVADECDIAGGTSQDCNTNSTPDECDIAAGTSEDCNGNGVPDDCDLDAGTSEDCNANGFPDECDIAAGASQDQDANGIPDECEARLDIKPASCPNSFNRDSHGVLPVSLVGATAFDISQVDLATVLLSRADGLGTGVAPHEGPPGPQSIRDDTATPFVGETCDCHERTGDGIIDLSMRFKTDELVPALGLGALSPGALVELTVSGNLLDGTAFAASDCVRLVPPGTGPGTLTVNSNLPQAWIDIVPLDMQLDGGGFGQFDRTWPRSTVVTFAAEEFYLGQRFVGWKFNGLFLSRDMTADVTVIDEPQTVDALFRRTGDITGDEAVNLNDFAMFAVCFGRTWGTGQGACSNEALASSDLDRNGVIDLRDFAIFAIHFGT